MRGRLDSFCGLRVDFWGGREFSDVFFYTHEEYISSFGLQLELEALLCNSFVDGFVSRFSQDNLSVCENLCAKVLSFSKTYNNYFTKELKLRLGDTVDKEEVMEIFKNVSSKFFDKIFLVSNKLVLIRVVISFTSIYFIIEEDTDNFGYDRHSSKYDSYYSFLLDTVKNVIQAIKGDQTLEKYFKLLDQIVLTKVDWALHHVVEDYEIAEKEYQDMFNAYLRSDECIDRNAKFVGYPKDRTMIDDLRDCFNSGGKII